MVLVTATTAGSVLSGESAERAALRVALVNGDVLRLRRDALAKALIESAGLFHRAMKHAGSDWRRSCQEPECRAAMLVLAANAGT